MATGRLKRLVEQYESAPEEFHATSYWDAYEKSILATIDSIDLSQLRSGKYPVLATFGFNDAVFLYHPNLSTWKKILLKFIHNFIIKDRSILPYGINTQDIQEMAYRHCELLSESSGSKSIEQIEASTFGNPSDIFEVNNNKYTMAFLNYYIRYCFMQKSISLKGDEVIVELGSGSGYQIEVLKKLYPELTIICFDLPAQLYLCEEYLANAIQQEIVSSDDTRSWKDLSNIKKGGVHFFGNWQIPLLHDFKFDVFLNAASFGEMEPDVVENYLNYIKGNAKWIYLLQARNGKEVSGKNRVRSPMNFEYYKSVLSGYSLVKEETAWLAHGKLNQSGGYFQGIWEAE